jgi:hypothetical protein
MLRPILAILWETILYILKGTEAFANCMLYFFFTVVPWILILSVFYLPTDAIENCFKKNIKIYIKTAPTRFGAITIIREHIFEL